MAAPNIDHAGILSWLDGLTVIESPHGFLQEMCDRLVIAGLPLYRVAVFVRTLHPNVLGRRYLWIEGDEVLVSEAPYQMLETEEYSNNPMAYVFSRGEVIRRRLNDPATPNDFKILDELRADGVTDYLVHPLPFTNGEIHAVSWTTRDPAGFSDAATDLLQQVALRLNRVAEIYALRRTAATMLNTYVGHGAGERILSGQIRRGEVTKIRAAIWLSDLRGFTNLADTQTGEELIELLNAHFDAVVPAIEEHGGEVLKFMGDGVLAIFPAATDESSGDACDRAIASARAVRTRMAACNDRLVEAGRPTLAFGAALHFGDLMYGNIGGTSRLDFTAIGPAVNLAARLETLARDQGLDIVVSSAIVERADARLEQLGTFELKGFSVPERVFKLD